MSIPQLFIRALLLINLHSGKCSLKMKCPLHPRRWLHKVEVHYNFNGVVFFFPGGVKLNRHAYYSGPGAAVQFSPQWSTIWRRELNAARVRNQIRVRIPAGPEVACGPQSDGFGVCTFPKLSSLSRRPLVSCRCRAEKHRNSQMKRRTTHFDTKHTVHIVSHASEDRQGK